jgi:hypothetical protein
MAGLQLRPSIKADYMEAIMAEKQDMSAANDSYSGFIKMFKWGTVAAVVTTLIVVLIIASRAA